MNSHCWIEVNLPHLRENFRALRQEIKPSVKILTVVKANGYGHGLLESAKAFAEAGADYLGVSTLEEGLSLKEGGIHLPILVFLPLLPEELGEALKAGLTLTSDSIANLEAIQNKAEELKIKPKVHLKVETGLGRFGFSKKEFRELLDRRGAFSSIEFEGVYSHLEPFEEFREVKPQTESFEAILRLCEAAAFSVPIKHLAASHAVSHGELHFDMVRLGTVLYGQAFDPELQKKLKSAFTFKTRLVALRKVAKGEFIGYGKEYAMPRNGWVATAPVGYCEGFGVEPVSLNAGTRGLARVFKRLVYQKLGLPYLTFGQVRGKNAPVVGRVSMNMCQLDVTSIEEVRIGDEVVLPIRWVNTSPAIPRIYKA